MKWDVIAIIESGLLLLAISYIALLLGRLHRSQDRWKQGYDAGKRVGWYDAADLLRADLSKHQHNGMPVTRSGYQDAYMRLETYWDDLDRAPAQLLRRIPDHDKEK